MMDRLLTAGLCGNTIGQDIQTLTYHSSTSNMAFPQKDVCSSNFTWPLNMMLTKRNMRYLSVCVEARLRRTGSGALTCS